MFRFSKILVFSSLLLILISCDHLDRSKSASRAFASESLRKNDYSNSFIEFPKHNKYPLIPIRSDLGERILKNEKEAVDRSTKAIEITMDKRSQKGSSGRGDHSTSHGCYPAKVEIISSLAPELSAGITAPKNQGKIFKAAIRFSNSEPEKTKDAHAAGRGLALKIYLPEANYNSDEYLLDEWQKNLSEQDFLAGTAKQFMVKDIIDYSHLFMARARPLKKIPTALKNTKTLVNRGLKPRLRTKKSVPIIMEDRFWSSLPYAWGEHVAKFSFRPCHYVDKTALSFDHKEKRYQRKILNTFLQDQEICYEMVVQLRPNHLSSKNLDKYFPIENAKKFWPDGRSKKTERRGADRGKKIESIFQNIARIKIDKNSQPLDSEVCEKLVFNPWNGLKEHQPLSSLSRGRLSVYLKSKEIRYKQYKKGN